MIFRDARTMKHEKTRDLGVVRAPHSRLSGAWAVHRLVVLCVWACGLHFAGCEGDPSLEDPAPAEADTLPLLDEAELPTAAPNVAAGTEIFLDTVKHQMKITGFSGPGCDGLQFRTTAEQRENADVRSSIAGGTSPFTTYMDVFFQPKVFMVANATSASPSIECELEFAVRGLSGARLAVSTVDYNGDSVLNTGTYGGIETSIRWRSFTQAGNASELTKTNAEAVSPPLLGPFSFRHSLDWADANRSVCLGNQQDEDVVMIKTRIFLTTKYNDKGSYLSLEKVLQGTSSKYTTLALSVEPCAPARLSN